MSAGGIRWVPIESNPDLMTKYIRELGSKKGEWVDVYALDDDSLSMIPKPVEAVILLFPISDSYDQFTKGEDEKIKEKGQVISDNLFYMRQTVGNACGTIGIIHSLANNKERLGLEDGLLKEFLDKTAKMNPMERAVALESADSIAEAHEGIASEGQTAAPDRDDKFVTHFVAFVHKDGHLYELDGRREFPINHGTTTAENLLKDAAAVCKARIERDKEEYRYTIVALTTG